MSVVILDCTVHIFKYLSCLASKKRNEIMNCRTLLSVAPRVVGVETQRKGKEVKRRGGENHV